MSTAGASRGPGWALLAIYAVWSFGGQQALAGVLTPLTRNLVEQGLLTAFFLVHAFAWLTVAEVGAFAVICFVVSNVFENLSVETGFPFGLFEHSTATGPRLFNIPWLATPTYMAMGYVSWMVAQVLVDRRRPSSWRHGAATAAIVAGFVFTMWDVSNDAVFHTMNRAFTYANPGPWFGVPSSNFLGWLLATFVLYGLFATWLAWRSDRASAERSDASREYWLQAVAMYLAVALAGVYRNLRGHDVVVTLANGDTWRSADLYGAMTIATLFTMGFVVVLALERLGRVPYDDLDRRPHLMRRSP